MLKKLLMLPLALYTVTAQSAEAEENPYWTDLGTVSVNKIEPRSSFMTYPDRETALTQKFENSRYYRLLNGQWKFYFTEDHRNAPADIHLPSADARSWNDITVPGNWEVQGYGTALYVNHPYEFQPRNPQPPKLPENTPMGVYRRDIEIPSDWKGRDIYLHIAGAKSGVYVYLNGKEVGYNEDSKNPAEYLLNNYIQDGTNVLTLKIYRWSTGSYLECQDFWRISGIERDVFLWSQPKTAVKDFRVISTLDDTYRNGIFDLAVDIRNSSTTASDGKISIELLDPSGKAVFADSRNFTVGGASMETVAFEHTLENVPTWTSEAPNLFKLVMTLEKDGKTEEVIPFNVGFRRIEIKPSGIIHNGRDLELFYVNGQPIKLKGVNIHEHSQYTGHYVTEEEMETNFRLMKENNINTVRLAHYPQDRKFYELCDKYGLYVYDEANIESHGMYYDLRKGKTLANNPDWLYHHMARIQNMYERNKNYPSVTIFSLGNEAGNGYNFYQAYLYVKNKEKELMGRPVNYERAQWEWNTDMYVPQYPSAKWLEEIGAAGADRPIVPSEYAHAMGNSTGDLYGQWQAIYEYPQLQGGYLWDWIDQGILEYDGKGRPYWAYGGDYGVDSPSDGNFLINGIIGPDQVPHPGIAEVKYTHQNVGFEEENAAAGKFRVTNRFYFTDLYKYRLAYEIIKNGVKVSGGDIPLQLPPQQSQTVTVPVQGLSTSNGAEYFVNFNVYTVEPEPLLEKGHIIAYDQFRLPLNGARQKFFHGRSDLTVSETDGMITVSSRKVNFQLDKNSGMVTSYKVDGTQYIDKGFGLQPNFWRGMTDNDYGQQLPRKLQVWKEASSDFNIVSASARTDEGKVAVSLLYKLPSGNEYEVLYEVYPSGVLKADIKLHPENAEVEQLGRTTEELTATFSPQARGEANRQQRLEVPRVGVRFRLPASMDNITYYGRGPEENYCDRYKGTPVGLYSAKAWELYHPYVRPQENGHHTDTRWVAATDSRGRGLLIQGRNPIGFNALRNSVEDFDCEESDAPYMWNNFSEKEIAERDPAKAKNNKMKQTHINDIEPRDFVEVCLDMKQMGVSGYNGWGSRPVENAIIYADEPHEWGFTIIPVKSKKDIQEKAYLEY